MTLQRPDTGCTRNIGMTDEEFDRHLSPAAKEELGTLGRRGETAPPVPPGYPPSFATDPEGTLYRSPAGERFKKQNGELTPTLLGTSSALGLPRLGDIGRAVLGGPVPKGQWEVQRP